MRAGNALPVQRRAIALARSAGGVLLEDPPHDRGLGRLDPAQPALRQAVAIRGTRHDRVAVAAAAARAALLDPAAQAAVGLLRQVLEEERVHRALEPDMQLADLALGHGHQPHAGEGQLLEQAGDVLLVAAQPVQRLGDHDVEPAGAHVLEQPLVARPQRRGAAHRVVGVDLGHRPALPLGQLAAQPHLVLDRGLALRVRASSGHRSRPAWLPPSQAPLGGTPPLQQRRVPD